MMYFQRAIARANRSGLSRLFGIVRDTKGNAGIEFALVVPIFVLILVASVDLGMLVFSRFQLEAAVSASASYAIAHADQVDGNSGDGLAKNIALMIASNHLGDATASIQINNGAQASYDGATIKIGGVLSQANACYCPKGDAASLDWGAQLTCNSSCPEGGRAGKYVLVAAKQAYTPLFPMFDVVKNGSITAGAIVQTK